MSIDGSRLRAARADAAEGVVASLAAVRTAYVCSDCGYGITVGARLPTCPMCGADAWQREAHRGPDLRWGDDGGAPFA